MKEKSNRKVLFLISFGLVGLVFLAQLFYLQVIDDSFKALADNNAIRKITTYPTRGLVFDTNEKLIVSNEPVYDLLVTPRLVKEIDTVKFCALLNITPEDFDKRMKKAIKHSRYKPSIFLKQVSKEMYARFQEYLYQFPGFYPQVRTLRKYPFMGASHVLGYIGEVNRSQISGKDSYYKLGDYTGKTGIEYNYEERLRGEKGYRYVMVDVFNREQGTFDEGSRDTPATSGEDLQLSLDIELQQYGETLMQNKIGSIVAIEPSSGQILSLVSSPGYDPNLLNGRERGSNYNALQTDTLNPLFNRPIMASYIPGSTLKPMIALIALQEGVIHANRYFECGGYYRLFNLTLHCSHSHKSCHNVADAIKESCNPYFWQTFRTLIETPIGTTEEALLNFNFYLNEFGFGRKLSIDIPNEVKGITPSIAQYNKWYGKGSWSAPTIISLGIGQGELGATPLQLANFMAICANRGHYYNPHMVVPVEGDTVSLELYKELNSVSVDRQHFETVIEGLERTVVDGTAKIANVKDLNVVGKTGTADNPHGKPHSVFIAFAPKNDPKIAIAVVVENAGYGSTYAAPIASLMIEQYMKGGIEDGRKWIENKMIETDLINMEDE